MSLVGNAVWWPEQYCTVRHAKQAAARAASPVLSWPSHTLSAPPSVLSIVYTSISSSGSFFSGARSLAIATAFLGNLKLMLQLMLVMAVVGRSCRKCQLRRFWPQLLHAALRLRCRLPPRAPSLARDAPAAASPSSAPFLLLARLREQTLRHRIINTSACFRSRPPV